LIQSGRRQELSAGISGPAVADPGSVNLATYLSALGLTVKPETLAAKIGADRNTLGRAIHRLAASGLVAMAATKTGTG
jgi:hypothetical protein